MTYAENTSVSTEKSRSEIERILERYGAEAFSYGWEGERAVVAFRAMGRMIRFEVTMPPLEEFATTETGRARKRDVQIREREQATRQRWRALALVIKAKLEAVEAGISTFEQEFMANVLLPDGTTVGDFMEPQIAEAYETGAMPSLLPAGRPQLMQGEVVAG